MFLNLFIQHRTRNFHTFLCVSRHHICRSDINLSVRFSCSKAENTRGCSRYLPTTLITRTFSVYPGHTRQEYSRYRARSDPLLHLQQDASDTFWIKSTSVTEFIFIMIRPFAPFLISSSIMYQEFSASGWSVKRSDDDNVRPDCPIDIFLKNAAASFPIAGSAVISDRSVYIVAVFSL